MTKQYKIVISILALVFSIGAFCIGAGLIGHSNLDFGTTWFCHMFFLMQAVTTSWVVGALVRKEKKK